MSERSKASYRRRRATTGRSVKEARVAPPGKKWCPGCETFKDLDAFCANKRTKSGRAVYCRDCHNLRSRETRERLYGGGREYHLRARYGIGQADYDRMLAKQDGLCAACRLVAPHHVDHDHATGKVRGLLCFNCNQALGNVRDKTGVLLDLAVYLQRHNARRLRSSRDFHNFKHRGLHYEPTHRRVG